MRHLLTVAILFVVLLVPANALGQTADRIAVLDNFGTYQRGESLFVFGTLASIDSEASLVMQIVNPNGDLCQIQQITPLSSGVFLTDPIPLSGSICGLEGDYGVKLFYGDHTKSSAFSVSGVFASLSDSQLFDNAEALVSQKIQSIVDESELDLSEYTSRLNSATTLDDLESLYVDLWDQFLIEDAIFDVNPIFRPVVSTALDSSANLLQSGEISLEISKNIERSVYAAIFNYEIGNTNRAVLLANDVFVQLKNVNPIKTQPRKLSFSELEDTLLTLMKKTDTVMSSEVREEIAFILARGTAPLFVDELSNLVDLLSESRYLDVVSRKDTPLYRLINSDWDNLRGSLTAKNTIEELLDSKSKIDNLYDAALLLRQLDRVDRFISSDAEENSVLANLLKPEWDSLTSSLELASTVQDILDAESEIHDMKSVIEISSRLAKSVDIAQSTGVSVAYIDEWEALLSDVKNASSITEILSIVSTFDSSISEMREKRNPLVSLKFEFEQLKQKAEIQADYKNLVVINQALKIIESAEQTEEEKINASKIDRAEVLLTWVSQIGPSIRSELEKNVSKATDAKASDILQRTKSIENLVELSMTKNKFLPGYTDFTDSMNERLDDVRDLVMRDDLSAADALVHKLFEEWRQVSAAYASDPSGSKVGYSLDELHRIEFREQLEEYANIVSTFYNSDFDAYSDGYEDLVDEADELIEYGNFIDADKTIKTIGKYLEDHLPLKNSKIIYDISYDQESDIWVLRGAVDKQVMDRREPLYVTIYNVDGDKHSFLEFTDTRKGDFFTQWVAPTEPGLYVVMLQYRDIQASQIAHVVDTAVHQPRQLEYNSAELAREFTELQSFMERFGGENYKSNSKFSSTILDIKSGLANRSDDVVRDRLDDLQRLIERYLPVRSPSAVIETQFDGDTLHISGAVKKNLAFSEDLYVDIFDMQGSLVQSIALKDSTGGMFNESLSIPFSSGVHVAQLEYHDLTVTDFFTVP